MTERAEVFDWLRGYAAELADAVAVLASGEAPGEEFLARCQDFDTRVRRFDVGVLRSALGSAEGRHLTARLTEVKSEFEAAMVRHQAEIEGRIRDLGAGRTALRGYADAGEHQRAGALYLEKSL